ncbi:DUF6302 family protein [Actinacidiphila rubida]|uniref:Uncharacterized protein n=1 Tax=Actinacidiphila rubida TaxID=310780 RepID=A0A1H8UHS8_9ACTN|nr:DUF6302 family protein [Actinacidiphila rubida]SEP02587.1 hypothetical protein SAMN05216267_107310 [Actinacidiphila rubida]
MTVVRPLIPRLVSARLAYDFEYFANRLADPSLLDGAVGVCIHRAPLLAVPTGGSRRGGSLSVDLLVLADKTRRLLTGLPGFADVRVRASPFQDARHVVEWGDQPPTCAYNDAARRRFYGYTEDAIRRSHPGHGPPTPSSTAPHLSPPMS